MFRERQAIRFSTVMPEAAVVRRVRDALGGLGRVEIDKWGVIRIEPAARFHSFLTETDIRGLLRRRGHEYEVRIDYTCEPSLANWVIMAAGTLTLLVGWVGVFAPLSAKRALAEAVRNALRDAEVPPPGAPGRQTGGAVDERLH
jgi:hypothetical protein